MSKQKISIKLNLMDHLVNAINPKAGLERVRAKAALGGLESVGFITPGSRRRSMRGWNPVAQSADTDSLPVLDKLRAGSRDLWMNSPLAGAALKRVKTNAVGSGLTLLSAIDSEVLNLTEEQTQQWQDKTEREFKLWAESKQCDATQTQNFYELQSMVLLNSLLSGDCFVALPILKRKNEFPYGTALKIIEADFIVNPYDGMDNRKIAGGIEVDDMGAAVAYHIKVQKYGDMSPTWSRVTAFGENTGRRNILHIFEKERPGQRRGIPFLAPVIETLKQMTSLSQAELAASVVSSFFTVFVKSNSGTGLAEGYIPPETVIAKDTSTGEAHNDVDKDLYEMGPASIIELGEDEEIQTADPSRPNDSFEPFFLAMVKQLGSNLEIPFEQILLHFQASYSASRAALLEAWKFYRVKRTWLTNNFCQPVYEEWLHEAITIGRIQAPGFFEDMAIRKAWAGSVWIGPGQGQIDPIRETRASLLKIKGNLSSHSAEYTSVNGGDWQAMSRRLGRENKLLEKEGLTPVTNQQNISQGTDLK